MAKFYALVKPVDSDPYRVMCKNDIDCFLVIEEELRNASDGDQITMVQEIHGQVWDEPIRTWHVGAYEARSYAVNARVSKNKSPAAVRDIYDGMAHLGAKEMEDFGGRGEVWAFLIEGEANDATAVMNGLKWRSKRRNLGKGRRPAASYKKGKAEAQFEPWPFGKKARITIDLKP